MKDQSPGKTLLTLYGVYLAFIFMLTHFQIDGMLQRGGDPLLGILPKILPESILLLIISAPGLFIQLYVLPILCIIIQAFILYYGGNYLEKLLKKS